MHGRGDRRDQGPVHRRVDAGIDQNGEPVEDTFAAELTGLLDLGSWHKRIPGLRIIVRNEPLHPRYRKRATERGPGPRT